MRFLSAFYTIGDEAFEFISADEFTRSPAPATQAPFLAGANSPAVKLEGSTAGTLGRGEMISSFHAAGVAHD